MRKRIPGGLNLRALAVLTARCYCTRLHEVPAVGSDSVVLHGQGQRGNLQRRGSHPPYGLRSPQGGDGTKHTGQMNTDPLKHLEARRF